MLSKPSALPVLETLLQFVLPQDWGVDLGEKLDDGRVEIFLAPYINPDSFIRLYVRKVYGEICLKLVTTRVGDCKVEVFYTDGAKVPFATEFAVHGAIKLTVTETSCVITVERL